ncbi:hypothetical protein GDO78_004774 [Eleutherodactylus coqui]|uniref:Uncharacterized protein n=1 Tax=Eleutherodactylus coqui TaxID=57060 RepID=A0A8J6K446_ELECQ|nr:hypothetical protein GDO78_004774 [Eleutherodactylus coqui]
MSVDGPYILPIVVPPLLGSPPEQCLVSQSVWVKVLKKVRGTRESAKLGKNPFNTTYKAWKPAQFLSHSITTRGRCKQNSS